MIYAAMFLLLLLFLNGILAMSELAVMTSRRSRLGAEAARGDRGAAAALALAADPTRFLSTVQVGITLIGILSGAFAERAIAARLVGLLGRWEFLAPHSELIALAIVVLAVTYFSLVPKRLALAYPEAVAGMISRPLAALAVAAAWPVRLLTASTDLAMRVLRVRTQRGDDVSEEDVESLMARAASTGVFTPQEHALFKRVLRVGDLTVRDLMVPRTEIVWIEEDTPMDSLRVLIGTNPYSHFPVGRGSLDSLLGVVHIKDLIAYGLVAGSSFKVANVAHQPLYVPETMPALKLLDQFKQTKTHVAIVVDEFGAMLGLLTLNDVLAALIGDIGRRGEAPPPQMLRRPDGTWLFDGRVPLLEAVSALGIAEVDLPDVSTIAGLAMTRIGHVPREGEFAAWRGWKLEVVDMDGTRIDKILATRVPDAGPRSDG